MPDADRAHSLERDLDEVIAAAFRGRLTIGSREAARLLAIDPKLLRRHASQGNIVFIEVGFGIERVRREFTAADIRQFILERRRRQNLPGTPGRRRPADRSIGEGFLETYGAGGARQSA